jgi:predicted ATP-grasp superfamily ATP-dependent carboligase
VLAPAPPQYEFAVDKYAVIRLAEGLGIDTPRTQRIVSPRQLGDLDPSWIYPLVLKPVRSRSLVDGRWISPPVAIVRSARELAEHAARIDAATPMLLQEYVPGGGEAWFGACRAGRPIVEFAHRRLREKPPTGGESVLREAISLSPDLSESARMLVAALGWTGVLMVEFRRAPNGRLALMEINPRLWGSVQLAIDAGIDFPKIALDLYLGNAIEVGTARLGIRSRWLLGDVDHLLALWRSAALRSGMGQSRSGALAAFVRSFVDGTKLEVLRQDDPAPFFREVASWLRALR